MTIDTSRALQLARAQRVEIERELGKRSFYEFFKLAWHQLDPVKFLDNWHIKLVCDELQAAACREHRNLVVCIPPRHGKSLIVSQAFPAWVWTWWPAAKFITASYAMDLATRDAVATRRLVQSEWYQARWGGPTAIKADRDRITFYETEAGGYRMATSTNARVTGFGADIILCLPPDAVVRTELGLRPIDAVVQGPDQMVLAFDHAQGAEVFRPIARRQRLPARELVEIETADGQTLRCTLDHPVWVEGRGYVPAAEVREGDEVLTCPDAFTGCASRMEKPTSD